MKGWGKDIGDSVTLGFELVFPTLLGALAGFYLDRHFNSSPMALFIGVFLGAGAGLWNVVRRFLSDTEKKEKR